MASFRERAEADLRGTTVEAIQAQNTAKTNKSFRERAQEDLSRSSQQANTAYRTRQRRQKLHDEEQERKRAAQNKARMQQLGRQTTRQRIDTGENESQLGYGNYLSYKGVDQREIPWKEMTENQIAKAKQAATEKQASKTHVRNPGDTILDTANAGAGGGFVTGVAKTADFLANLLPNAEAKIMGQENPEGTFTGQLLKPLTDATQKFSDWTQAETEASAQRAREDVGDSKIGQLAVELGSGVVGAIPNAVLAMMTGGGSLAGEVGATLAPQAAGASSTILNSVKNVVSNPSFQMSYIQTLGGAYQDAKDAGASELDATAAAFISSAANALVEVGGGLETLPGKLKAEDLSTFDKALKWVTSAFDEGKEELVQGVISALTNKAAANNDTPYFSMEDENAVINPARMGKEFGMGAAVGGILSGAQMLGTEAINRRANRAGSNAGTNADGSSNAQANANSTDNNVLSVDRSAGQNADPAVADNVTATDPMEFAVRETMKPTKERQAVDEALQRTADWMLGKEKAATTEAETVVADTTRFDSKILENLNKARTYFIDYAKSHFPTSVVNKNTGNTIDISRNGLDKFLSGKISTEKYASGFHIPELIERAYKVSEASNYHTEQTQNAPTYEYYDSPIKIGDTEYTAHIRVKNSVMGDKYYGHTISEVDNIEIEPSARASVPGEPAVQSVNAIDDSINTISHSNQNVNQNQDKNFDNDMGHGSVGAAELGFNPYSNYQNQTDAAGFMPEGANAVRPVDMPKVDPTGKQVRSGAKTIYGAEATTNARATQMESEYMEGLYGYDPVRDKPTLERAKANLQEEGYDRAYSRVAEKLSQVKDMKQTAMEAFLLYSDAVQSGRDADAANLCLLLSESGTEFGQGAQVFAMFRKLSPEGQLYALQKSVERLNAKMNSETSQDITIKQEALRDIVKTRDAALQMLEQLNSRDHGVPVEDWMQEVGKQLAKAVGEMPTPPKPKTVAQTIRGDLLRFAKQYLPKKAKGNKRTSTDMLRDFYSNKELYYEAWDSAREAYAKKNGPSSAFAEASMTGVPENSVMLQAIIDEIAGQELKKRNINIRTQLGDTSGLVSEISDSIISKTGAADIDAREIRGSVQQYFNDIQHDVEHGTTKSGKNKLEQTNANIQSDISKVVREMGQTAADVIRSSDQSKAKTAKAVADALVSQYGISKKNAKTAANMIVDQFNQYVAEKSESTLRNMFEQREGKKSRKRTFDDRFDELVNLGAFTNENWASAVNEKMFGPGVTLDPSLVQNYIDAPNQQVRDMVMDEIYQNIGEQIPTTFGEAAGQWRYMSMLLNPSTHLKNMGGNISMMMLKGSKDVVGTGLEVVANAVTGGKTGRTKSILNPLSAKDRSLMGTAWADFDNVRDDVAGIGKNSDNLMGRAGEYRNLWKLNDPKTKAGQVVDQALRTAEKVPQANTKSMNLEDQLFSQPDYALSLAGYMKANHQTEITAEARAYAIKEAKKATFRDANEISTFARNMGHTNSKLWNGIVNAVFPFKGTPANVGVRAVEYSPLGFVNTVAQAIKAKNNGTFKATDFIDNISANLVGSALSVFGYWLASNGWLRVSGVGDDKEKAEQKENGYKDNSFQLFGYSVPENSFTSVSAPMFIGAAAYEALATKALTGEAYTLDDYLEALSTTVDPLLEQTMLTGLDDVLTTARYNQGGFGDTLSEMGLQVAGSYLSSYIPTLLSRVSAAADGTQRQVYIDKNKPLQGVQRQVQNLMMKTPARKYLNERVDRYGNVQEQEGIFNTGNEKLDSVLNFGYNVVTPSYASKIQENPISDELSRLYRSSDVDNSERKLFQSDAPKSIQVNGVTKNLTGEQYENYEKIRGSNTTEYMGALQGDSLYDSMDDAMQGYATDKMHDYIEQTSKAELGIGYEPTDDWIADLQGKSEAEIVETVLYKTFESAVTSKEYSSKYEGMADLVDQDKLSDAMAITMMPEKMKTAYRDVAKKGGVSVDEWLDMYAYAYPSGKTETGGTDNEKIRTAALEYIDKQNWGDSKKTAAASAIFQYLTDTIPLQRDIPYDWALKQGDSGLAVVENSMSETQKKNYEKYIKGHLDDEKMELYLDAYKFKGTAKNIYEEDGETVKKSAKEQVIEYIDSLEGLSNREKIRIFLGLNYSEKNIPYWWYY